MEDKRLNLRVERFLRDTPFQPFNRFPRGTEIAKRLNDHVEKYKIKAAMNLSMHTYFHKWFGYISSFKKFKINNTQLPEFVQTSPFFGMPIFVLSAFAPLPISLTYILSDVQWYIYVQYVDRFILSPQVPMQPGK